MLELVITVGKVFLVLYAGFLAFVGTFTFGEIWINRAPK